MGSPSCTCSVLRDVVTLSALVCFLVIGLSSTAPHSSVEAFESSGNRERSGGGGVASGRDVIVVPAGSQVASFAVTKPGPFPDERQMIKIGALTELVLATMDVLSKRQLTTWAIECTLLGIYRHAALLPYDFTADIGVLASQFDAVIKVLANQFGESSLEVKQNYARVSRPVDIQGRDQPVIECWVNIYAFAYDAKTDTLLHPGWINLHRAPANEVLPVKWAKLHHHFVPVPSETEMILKRSYGGNFSVSDKMFDWKTMRYLPATNSTSPSEFPLVSVIMPTYNRAQFLTKAIELLKRQDYPNIELIIVDDSPKSSEKMMNKWKQIMGAPWIHYYHLPERLSIGAKRNMAVELASGEIIVHWDDDDYYREFRITQQIAPIIRLDAEVTVLEHHYYFEILAGQFYTVRRLHSWGPHCGTLAYSKSLFAKRNVRFPDNSLAEDYAFAEVAILNGARLLVLDNTDGKHIYVRHYNTWQFDLAKEYAAEIRAVARPWFFAEADYKYYTHLKPADNNDSPPPNNYAWSGILWTLPELQPPSEHGVDYSSTLSYPTYYLAYPRYPHYLAYPQYPGYPHYPHYPRYPHYLAYPQYPGYPHYPHYSQYQPILDGDSQVPGNPVHQIMQQAVASVMLALDFTLLLIQSVFGMILG